MKNKKMMIVMIVTISILLIIAVIGTVLNLTNKGIIKIAKNQNNSQQSNMTVKMEINENDVQTSGVINENSIVATVSSRSDVNRFGKHVNINPEENQSSEDYKELVEYTKLENVKISFDMDVSKTTGLSKEDFISLVQNMKCDRTGILGKNAGWIWECCQKYNVNEIFVLGICGIESAWCSAPQHQNTHNYSSLMTGGKLIPYPNDEAGFEAMIKLLGERYLTPGASFYHGATITGVGRCYCDPTSWSGKVYTCMKEVLK